MNSRRDMKYDLIQSSFQGALVKLRPVGQKNIGRSEKLKQPRSYKMQPARYCCMESQRKKYVLSLKSAALLTPMWFKKYKRKSLNY